MNYEDMTDFEINKAVATSSGAEVSLNQFMEYDDRDENAVLISVFTEGDSQVDYCNNPSDAWPIILENKISLIKTDDDRWTAFEWENDKNESWHKNPLRAAMIVYLMMNEDKK